jgi:hypothetical protein
MDALTPFDWDEFMLFVRDRRVIPIVGRELMTVGGATFDTLVARALAEDLKVELKPGESPTVSRVAAHHLEANGRRTTRLYSRLKIVVDRLNAEVPAPLRQLAQVSDFDLFVSTTFDQLLENALRLERPAADVSSFSFSPFATVQDLPQSWTADQRRAAVFQIFGRASPYADYALTEEDLLEFMHALQSESKRPRRLFDALREHHLLFLGCGFPDWLSRFFIRTMNNERFFDPQRRSEFVADARLERDEALSGFLRQYDTHLYAPGDAVEFVSELHRRWTSEKREQPSAARPTNTSSMPEGAVFLSYARENQQAVRLVHDALEEQGIPVWFDERELTPGIAWDREIQENILRCSLFLPFVSRETESRVEGYFRSEWQLAIDRSRRIARSVPFIIPVSLDGTNETAPHVPSEFRQWQWAQLAGSGPNENFVSHVKQSLRRVRAPQFQ